MVRVRRTYLGLTSIICNEAHLGTLAITSNGAQGPRGPEAQRPRITKKYT